MGKYLKMAEYFDEGDVLVDGSSLHDASGVVAKVFVPSAYANYAAHAINSHDELVAEIERLRSENQSLMKCRMAAREFFNCTVASGGSVKVSSANKAALDDADKASDWLEIELKATADLVKK